MPYQPLCSLPQGYLRRLIADNNSNKNTPRSAKKRGCKLSALKNRVALLCMGVKQLKSHTFCIIKCLKFSLYLTNPLNIRRSQEDIYDVIISGVTQFKHYTELSPCLYCFKRKRKLYLYIISL